MLTIYDRVMSAELYSDGKGQYSLEQLRDFYALDPDEIESNVEVHTFSSQRDADFFLEGVEATGRLDMDHKSYIARYGDDLPEIRDWQWGGATAAKSKADTAADNV